MSDVALSSKFQKIFEKVKAQELECHLAILNYFWKHWDELSEKQLLYVEGQNIQYSRIPYSSYYYGCFNSSYYYGYFIHEFSNIFPEDIDDMMIDLSIKEPLNELLWHNRKYRKKAGKGGKRMTRDELIERYCVHIGV